VAGGRREVYALVGGKMPFGLVTKKQLDALAADLRREIEESVAFKDEMEYAWTGWYAKYRALYARLMKQAKKIEDEEAADAEAGNGSGATESVPSQRPLFRSRRGF
jgi:hypothetical protein